MKEKTLFENKILEINKENNFKKKLSISKILDQLIEPFDSEATAQKTFEKHFDDQFSKYYKKTKEEILNMWAVKANTSRYLGSLVDQYAELILNKEDENKIKEWKLNNNFSTNFYLKNLCKGFDNFYNKLTNNSDYKFIAREVPIFYKYKDIVINGRFDCLFYSETQKEYLLVDWKSNEEIKMNNRFSKMFGPMADFDNCDINRYTLQLQFYKAALLETYRIQENINLRIIHFLGNEVPDSNYFEVLKEKFEFNKNKLDAIIEFANEKLSL